MTPYLKGLISLVVFILPVALVKVGGSLLGSPGRGTAVESLDAVKPRPFKPPGPQAVSWTAQQKAAADHVAILKTQPFSSTPFYYRHEEPGEKPPDDTPPDDTPPELYLQVVLTSRRGNVALIDSKPYRVGDLIKREEWRVIKIDGHDRSVTLKHEKTDRTALIYVPTSR